MCRLRTDLIVRSIRRLGPRRPSPTTRRSGCILSVQYSTSPFTSGSWPAPWVFPSPIWYDIHRRFGQSPGRFLTGAAAGGRRSLLVSGDESIGWVAARVGFGDPLYFSRYSEILRPNAVGLSAVLSGIRPAAALENAPLPNAAVTVTQRFSAHEKKTDSRRSRASFNRTIRPPERPKRGGIMLSGQYLF
jgi:AraC-like DNA-binding protein